MKTELSTLTSGGISFNASIPTDKGQHFGLSHKDDKIILTESHEITVEKIHPRESKWNEELKKYEYFKVHSEYIDTENGPIEEFNSIESALEFLRKKYGIDIIYDPYSKELTNEQTIIEKLGGKIPKGQQITCVEYELVKFVFNNPGKSTRILQNMFEGGESSQGFDYSILSRLCHDYGKDSSPILIQEMGPVERIDGHAKPRNEGWIISKQGKEFLKKCEESIKQNGFIKGDFY